MASTLPRDINILEYAGDILLYVTDASFRLAYQPLARVLASLHLSLFFLGLEISPNKSQTVPFTRRLLPSFPENVILDSLSFQVTTCVKFLGLLFDMQLSWAPKSRYIVSRCERDLNIFRLLCRSWWGAHPTTMFTRHRALVRSRAEYGLLVSYDGTVRSRTQFHCVRLCLGVISSTPTNELRVVAVEHPLHLRRDHLVDKFILCCVVSLTPNNHAYTKASFTCGVYYTLPTTISLNI